MSADTPPSDGYFRIGGKPIAGCPKHKSCVRRHDGNQDNEGHRTGNPSAVLSDEAQQVRQALMLTSRAKARAPVSSSSNNGRHMLTAGWPDRAPDASNIRGMRSVEPPMRTPLQRIKA